MDINKLKQLAGIYSKTNENLSATSSQARIAAQQNFRPGTQEWFRAWFAKPHLTGETPLSENVMYDVPSEEWLNRQIEYAKTKRRNEFGAPYLGSVTGFVKKEVLLPISLLKTFNGIRGEQKLVRKDSLYAIINIMKETGKLPLKDNGEEYAPFVVIGWDGVPWVSEGNHRIMAAAMLEWEELPVELRYFDGGERVVSGLLFPGKIGLNAPTKWLREDATSGSTSAGNIATVVSPDLAIGNKKQRKKYGKGKKVTPPAVTQAKNTNGTVKNALDMNVSLFGGPIKR